MTQWCQITLSCSTFGKQWVAFFLLWILPNEQLSTSYLQGFSFCMSFSPSTILITGCIFANFMSLFYSPFFLSFSYQNYEITLYISLRIKRDSKGHTSTFTAKRTVFIGCAPDSLGIVSWLKTFPYSWN